jgi:Protein of unknown function (DUF1769)
MELGLIMRSVCKAVCNFGSSIITDLHFSFGDVQTVPDYQLPHMAAPLFTTMDKVIVTPENGVVPKMGVPFFEEPENRKKRMKYRSIEDANIKMSNIYSFSVASSNIDFCQWSTVGIPMVRPMDLRTIWGDSDLRLVAYEIPKEVKEKYPGKHPQTMVNYLLNIKVGGISSWFVAVCCAQCLEWNVTLDTQLVRFTLRHHPYPFLSLFLRVSLT